MVENFTVAENNDEGCRNISLAFDFGGTTVDAVGLFGEEAVYSQFVKGAKVSLQAAVRTKLCNPENTEEDIIAFAASWRPGIKTARSANKQGALEKYIAGLSVEEKEALVAKLLAMTTT